MTDEYKGFDKKITKEDLNKEELKCYKKLMEGIKDASPEEKEEVDHLMNVFIEAEEKIHIKCARCGKDFENESLNNKKIYCDECLGKMWS